MATTWAEEQNEGLCLPSVGACGYHESLGADFRSMWGIRGGNPGPDLGSEASSVDGRRKAPEPERMKGEGRMHTSQARRGFTASPCADTRQKSFLSTRNAALNANGGTSIL